MRKALICVALLLSGIRLGSAQVLSTVPQLESLHNGDAIAFWSAQLPSSDVAFLKQLTRGVVAGCVENPQATGRRTAAELFFQIRIEHITFSPSRPSGLVVQGAGACMCDASGNCPFWIIDHHPRPTVVLKAHSVQSFALMNSQAEGHFDFVLGTSGPENGVKELQTFRFDGKKYQRKGCATLAWVDQYGTLILPPKISPAKCRSNGASGE